MNNLTNLKNKGQSIWLDSISKQMIDSGDLKKIIDEGVTGITSNPSIFEKAISSTNSYDSIIEKSIMSTKNPKDIFELIASNDIKHGADLLYETYESTNNDDGYVSLEVDPSLANNKDKTIEEALKLWKLVDRPNLMIKIPGTNSGIDATKILLEMGININVTLLFSFKSYQNTLNAFIESRVKNKKSRSVASFFISRIDTAADSELDKNSNHFHKIAISNAYNAYNYFNENRSKMDQNFQKLLWASTSVKAEDLDQDYYCINLPMKNTVNTLPPETLNYLLKSKTLENSSLNDFEHYPNILSEAEKFINLDDITSHLLIDGIDLFEKSYNSLLDKIDEKIKKFSHT